MTRGPMPLEQRRKIAESNRRTKNAPPDDVRTCIACGATFACRPQLTRRFCSKPCSTAPGTRPSAAYGPKPTPLAERIAAKVVEEDGCLVWQGQRADGYGSLTIGSMKDGTRTVIRAHRAAWIVAHGDVPDLDLHHTCGNRACVNVAHLEPMDKAEHTALHAGTTP